MSKTRRNYIVIWFSVSRPPSWPTRLGGQRVICRCIIVICNYMFSSRLPCLDPGNSTFLLIRLSILFQPHQKHTVWSYRCVEHMLPMCLWWSCRVPPPGPARRLNCFNVTILFILSRTTKIVYLSSFTKQSFYDLSQECFYFFHYSLLTQMLRQPLLE